MTSIERIKEYLNVKSENLKKEQSPNLIAPDWPERGSIRFEDVSFRYDSSLPYVYKDLSMSIKPGEKVGVVGRTGAGKITIKLFT